MRLAKLALVAVVLAAVPLTVAQAHLLDHPVPTSTGTAPGLSTEFNSGGEGAQWDLLTTIPTLNPHSDLDFFQQKGETYASLGNLGIGPNGGGQIIFRLTEGGEVTATSSKVVSNHPSASCLSDPSAALGLQHDVEATPKSSVFQNTQVTEQNLGDTQLLLDATDALGRCHDQGTLGISNAPRGGLEIIDITDVENPVEIGLTSHIGQAHTVNVDPRRPHIAYVVSSDSVTVNAQGVRTNETGTGRSLDGFEVVNLRSCLTAPLGTIPADATVTQKRAMCRPDVYRFRYPSVDIAIGHTNKGSIYGCHELEVYPDDRLTCAAGAAGIVFDIAGVFNDAGTPADFTDDTLNGTKLPCAVRASSTAAPPLQTGAMVTDCVTGAIAGSAQDLGIPGWKSIGSPSLAGVQHVGSAFHMGREDAVGAAQPAYNATEDIDFDHELEFTDSRRFVIASDERGGGVTAGAQCSPGEDLEFANGGLHAYAVDRLQTSTPAGATETERADKAFEAYARNSTGGKAIFRAPIGTQPQGSFCTAHVFQQIPGENRIFMGWYSQGTQVVDFTENPDGTVDFKRAGFFIPENANQWVSAIFKVKRNADGTSTYFGATGDGIVGDAGRNGIDIYKVTLPAAPVPATRVGGPAPPSTPGLPPSGSPTPTPTPTATATETATATASPTATATETATASPTATATETATASPTATATETATASPTATATETATASPTATATETATASPTATATATSTPTATTTASPTSTATPTPTATPTATIGPPTPTVTPTPTPTTTETPDSTPTPTPNCSVTTGFSAADVLPDGRGLRFAFERSVDTRANISVFQTNEGRRLLRNRRVAQFSNRTSSFSWNGRSRGRALPAASYYVRYRIEVPGTGVDIRRFTVRRKNKGFVVERGFDQRPSCGLLQSAKLSRNVFGSTGDKPLGITFRLNEAAQVTVTVSSRGKVVKRFTPTSHQPGSRVRLNLVSKGLKRGNYVVEIQATRARTQATATLGSRRI